jgi:PKD repeat protein
VTATIKNFTHPFPADVDMVLVGPGGQNVMLMSDANGIINFGLDVFLTFDDAASAFVPGGFPSLPSGTYKPTNYGLAGDGDTPPGGGPPAPPYGASLAVFSGAPLNGTWGLYVWDDELNDYAKPINGGWCVSFTPVSPDPTANAGGPYLGTALLPITLNGTGSLDPDADIQSYLWDFGDGQTGTGPTPTHTYASAGTYTVTLTVTDAGGRTDDATTTATINPAGSYCNPASIGIVDVNRANPYPSLVTVSGAGATPFKVTVTLRGFTRPGALMDLDVLLVGPGGQKVMLMSDVAGGSGFQNATVTFDDEGSLQFPAGSAGTLPSGSYRPLNVGAPDAMPSPAPLEPYNPALSAFASTSPNGTWSLFVRDDALLGGSPGAVTGGWCVNIIPTNSAPVVNVGGPYAGVEGSPIAFDATASTDPDNNIETYSWDFGDGTTGSGATVQHTYGDDGAYEVTLTVTDAEDVSSTATTMATVANLAPTAVLVHNGPVTEGSAIQLTLTNASDVAADLAAGLTFEFDCGAGYGVASWCPTSDNGDVTVRGKVIDKDGGESEYTATVAVTNAPPVVTSLSLPSDPVAVNTPVSLRATFTDAGTADTHTGTFELGSGLVIPASAEHGMLSASVTFTQPGVYTVTASVSDDDDGTGSLSSAGSVTAFVVVYDPGGSFVTGGGWISSPAGAYAAEPTFIGKASFGFVAKYKPGASTPSGNTEFQFKAGDLSFRSTSYEWLVVAAAHAKYKGEGTINGGGSYGFMLTAVDGDRKGAGEPDELRIKIWDLSSGAVVYDNEMSDADDSPSGTALGGGSIVIHK